ncbi:hypothetical protein [Stenotrophomonas sp. 24(2023)]|uniref:hypothetical protein n=1 Tax=Stenotrophomonas sp. 24(2023) TaxID=3068324 RepID=UPI0027E0D0A0|nr:hypothetical protein [Stenotrophomonas sp. 24(2023)]WMJ67916.1 hypothetical protein Q9R17_11870 [Stenotrophomonas sp. 24(2023)]
MNRPLPSDDALRALHARAVQSLPPATLAQLRQARHAAPRRRAARGRWWLATACSLLVATGIGVRLLGDHAALPGSGGMPPPVAREGSAQEDNGALYDENPDLYLWLGDTDLAME